jgi:type II secretory pathway predicted ATPase ExeA
MYTGYFGLEEKPFSIAPNPDYLFMSDRHREALNHLTYGLGDTGGFVLLTGEVGTGKTTISRRLMENLPENTQAAFILNPTLSSQELLATLCDELKIRYRKTGATLKTLTDKIQEKLLKNHANDINTLLIIDEAQHLQPEVLEQLRLLTNLETNTKKLLQVILIGQPELQQLLQRRDLRQLAQRITARYHLLPLNKAEVSQYIKHRLSVAKCFRELFDKSAIAAIHKTSKGIPRLMNLLAERALMNAYNTNNAVVNKKMIQQAAFDALGDEYQVTPWWQNRAVKVTSITSILFMVLSSGVWWGSTQMLALEKLSHDPVSLAVSDNQPVNEQPQEIAVKSTEKQETALGENIAAKSQLDNSTDGIKDDTSQKLISANTPTIQSVSVVAPEPVPQESLVSDNNAYSDDAQQNVVNSVAENQDYSVDATEGVSDDLLARFQSAIEETKPSDSNSSVSSQVDNAKDLSSLAQMPGWVQDGVPSIAFDMHIYASDGQGWVRVNGRDRYEGDYIARELLLNEILPQKVVLSFRGEKFTMVALSSWN